MKVSKLTSVLPLLSSLCCACGSDSADHDPGTPQLTEDSWTTLTESEDEWFVRLALLGPGSYMTLAPRQDYGSATEVLPDGEVRSYRLEGNFQDAWFGAYHGGCGAVISDQGAITEHRFLDGSWSASEVSLFDQRTQAFAVGRGIAGAPLVVVQDQDSPRVTLFRRTEAGWGSKELRTPVERVNAVAMDDAERLHVVGSKRPTLVYGVLDGEDWTEQSMPSVFGRLEMIRRGSERPTILSINELFDDYTGLTNELEFNSAGSPEWSQYKFFKGDIRGFHTAGGLDYVWNADGQLGCRRVGETWLETRDDFFPTPPFEMVVDGDRVVATFQRPVHSVQAINTVPCR